MKTQQTPLTMVLSGRHGGEVVAVVESVLQPNALHDFASAILVYVFNTLLKLLYVFNTLLKLPT